MGELMGYSNYKEIFNSYDVWAGKMKRTTQLDL
jgi:hypothetical protein